MHFILDHLASIVPATIILMLLAALQLRTQDENIDAFRAETNRARMADLVHVVERDLRNIGSGTTQASILSWSGDSPAVGAPVTVFDFVTRVDTSAAAQPVRVQYQLAVGDSTLLDGETVYLLELQRLAVVEAGTTLLSRTPATLIEFNVQLLDQSDNVIAAIEQARSVRVQAASVSPFGRDAVTKDAHWSTTIRPVNLRPAL